MRISNFLIESITHPDPKTVFSLIFISMTFNDLKSVLSNNLILLMGRVTEVK
jgi:hypothetical protein